MFFKFSFSRKAQEGMSLNAVIGLVLAFIAVAVTVYVIFVFIGLFSKSQQELDSTLHNYHELTLKVEEIIKASEEFVEYERFPLYVSDGYSIIGFDKDQDHVIDQVENTIYKPSACRGQACICLYHMPAFYNSKETDDETVRDIGVVDCVRYRKPIKFFSKYRPHRFGHKDTAGDERRDIPRDVILEAEYFIIHGFMSVKWGPIRFFKTDWDINNIELRKTEEDDIIYLEISAVPDPDILRIEMIKEEAYKLLLDFLDTPVPQSLDDLTLIDVEAVLTREFLEQNPDVYQNKNYEEFLIELYTVEGSPHEKQSVFKSVSYSMFYDEIPTDEYGDPVGSTIFIDYIPYTDTENDYLVDLGALVGVTPIDLLVSIPIEIYIPPSSSPTEIAQVHFFITDIE